MGSQERGIYERVMALPLEVAEQALATGEFGELPDSKNYLVARAAIEARRAGLRDDRELATLAMARRSQITAWVAIAVSAASAVVQAMF